jgi:hypothetical protein
MNAPTGWTKSTAARRFVKSSCRARESLGATGPIQQAPPALGTTPPISIKCCANSGKAFRSAAEEPFHSRPKPERRSEMYVA